MVKWSFMALGNQRSPDARRDGAAFMATDGERFTSRGAPLPMRACLLEIKGDWAEFANTCGFPPWPSELFPCFLCKATRYSWHTVANLSPPDSPFPECAMVDYERACAACEHRVVLDKATHTLIKSLLRYDKRKDGSRGRCLVADVSSLSLRKGDRLQPSENLLDVGQFEQLQAPCHAIFWRRSAETRARQRNPLFHEGVGITLASFAIDTLHTLYLGPALDYCCHCLWLLILYDVFGTGAKGDERKVLSALRVRARLWEWYAQQRRDKPHESRTQVEDFTAAMLGTESKPSLGTNGMEAAGLVPFCVCMMVEHGATIGDVARSAQACGEALMQLVSILGSSPRRMSDDDVQKMYDATKRLLRLWHLCEFKKRREWRVTQARLSLG